MCGNRVQGVGSHPSPATVGLGKLLTCIELEFPHMELEMLIVMSFHNTYNS